MIKIDGTDNLWSTFLRDTTRCTWNSMWDFTSKRIINSVSDNISEPTWVSIGDHRSIMEQMA